MNSKLVSGVTEFLNTEGELREVIFKLLLSCEAVFIARREQGRSNYTAVQKLFSLLLSRAQLPVQHQPVGQHKDEEQISKHTSV